MKRRKSGVFAAVAVLAVLAATSACGSDDSGDADVSGTDGDELPSADDSVTESDDEDAEGQEPVDAGDDDSGVGDADPVQMSFFRSVPFDAGGAYYYVAQDQGYFAENGVEAEVVTGRGGAGTATAALITGSVDIAQGSVAAYLNAVQNGADLIAFWNFLDAGIFGVMINEASGATDIADLEGRTVGIIGPTSATYEVLLVMLAEAGVAEEDVNIVSLGCCAAQYVALLDGSVDAIGTWDVQVEQIYATAADEGEDDFAEGLNYIPSQTFLGDILLANRTSFTNDSQPYARFMSAMTQGMAFMDDDPQGALDIAANFMPDLDPNSESAMNILELRGGTTLRDGAFDHERVADALAIYEEAGLISVDPAVLDLERLFSNEVPSNLAD